MKSFIKPVESATVGIGLQFWHNLLVVLPKEYIFPSQRGCKIQCVVRVCNKYQMLTLHVPGCINRKAKVSLAGIGT